MLRREKKWLGREVFYLGFWGFGMGMGMGWHYFVFGVWGIEAVIGNCNEKSLFFEVWSGLHVCDFAGD